MNNLKQKTEDFFKEAMCVDGEVKLISFQDDDFKISAVIKFTDSKRGTFYLAQLSPNPKP